MAIITQKGKGSIADLSFYRNTELMIGILSKLPATLSIRQQLTHTINKLTVAF